MILFLIVGGGLNILAYFASVWSAQLNADVVKAAVENEHALQFKLKKGTNFQCLNNCKYCGRPIT